MLVTRPGYFDTFRCIAGDCPDSCCKEWDVQVDSEAAEVYRGLSGDLGYRLRQVLKEEDGQIYLTIEDGRCPMWRQDGLCRIQAELGEGALCQVCREFPRLRHDYGDFLELGLELSCPEAARLILNASFDAPVCQEMPGGDDPEYDQEAMAVLKDTRKKMLSLLSDAAWPVPETLALALLYGYQAQGELDGDEPQPFDPERTLEEVRGFAREADPGWMISFFENLEILTPQWKSALENPVPGEWSDAYRALARYFTERYWLQAVSDYDLYSRVKLIIISCLLIRHLGGDMVRTVQLYSKEIENNVDNVEAILDAAYTHPAFTDDKLLGMLLG